jgi:hypothetical protein
MKTLSIRFRLPQIEEWKRILPGICAFSALTGLLVLGHMTHWDVWSAIQGLQSASDCNAAKPKAGETQALRSDESVDRIHERVAPDLQRPDATDSALHRIPADAAKIGLLIGRASEEDIEESIPATGSVGYDQNRLAQLSVRVPGTVWMVCKQVGQTVQRG